MFDIVIAEFAPSLMPGKRYGGDDDVEVAKRWLSESRSETELQRKAFPLFLGIQRENSLCRRYL